MTTTEIYQVRESKRAIHRLVKRVDKTTKSTLWVLTTIVNGREVDRQVRRRLNPEIRSYFNVK